MSAWILHSELSTCFISDIDECAIENGGCDETCINTNGSYSCQCNSGLQLLADMKSCGCKEYEILYSAKL